MENINMLNTHRGIIILAVSIIAGQYGENIGTILAGSTIVVFPILIIFLIAQRYVIRGIAMTGLRF
ncbi:MAG: hypothetical protein NZ841_06310 [Dictyoglomus sp.]|nr:hypothetical protein [Dictyoglomus sp.]MDW8188890.1 hypothetical protein [Dictyoglomus sp.]